MATTNQVPPSGSFGVWQRLMRGYGPLAVFVVLLLAMSVLVPSKVPPKERTATDDDRTRPGATAPASGVGGLGAGSTPGGTDGSGSGLGGDASGAGGAGGPGGAAGPGTVGGGASSEDIEYLIINFGCPDRALQVPGDPYSPPCISWPTDLGNGGATTKGVTDSEIHVAFRVLNEKGFQQTLASLAGATLVDTPETVRNTVSALGEYFSKNFQFYGRKLVFDFYNGVGSNTTELLGGGVDKAEADADKVANELGSFADLSASSVPYADALAKRKVVGFGVPYASREWMGSRAPYSWSLATDCSVVTETVSDYALKKLFDQPAIYAAGDLKGRPRVITAIAPENSWYQECVNAGRQILRQGGKDWGAEPIKYQLDLGNMSNQAANLVPKLKAAGVTTIVCGCDPIFPVFLSGAAARAGYFPEYINVGVALTDTDIVGQLWTPSFATQAFGISALGDDASMPSHQSIGYAAYKTVRDDEPAFSVDLIYYQMYMLALGVQMAGPVLTPETFEAGMFAYPRSSGPAGTWGFGPGDYTPHDDVREIYWDPNRPSAANGQPGAWVNPAPGARFFRGNIPAGQPTLPIG